MDAPVPPILILAAGASSRMGGRDKLVEPVRGHPPLIRDRALAALTTGAPVFVTLPPGDSARHAALQGLEVTLVAVEAGLMGASLSAGIAALPPRNATGVLILLADMPDITTDDLTSILNGFDGTPPDAGGPHRTASPDTRFYCPPVTCSQQCKLSPPMRARGKS